MYIDIHIYVCKYVFIFIYTHVYMYIYTEYFQPISMTHDPHTSYKGELSTQSEMGFFECSESNLELRVSVREYCLSRHT